MQKLIFGYRHSRAPGSDFVIRHAFAFFCACIAVLYSMPSIAQSGVDLAPRLQTLEDPQHQLTINDLLSDRALPWKTNTQEIPSFGFSPHTYWVHFRIEAAAHNRLLQLDYALLDEVRLYRVESGRITEVIETGDRRSFANRPIRHRVFLFPVPPGQQTSDYYLQVRSSSAVQLPLTLWPTIAFFEADQNDLAEHGIYYGFVLVIALYNLFLFIRLRDTAYIFYVLYVATFALAQLSLSGFAYQFLWPETPEWNERSLAVITPMIVVVGGMFVSHFLKLERFYPRAHKLMLTYIFIGVVLAALSTQLPYATMIPYGAALAIVACATMFVVSYYITFQSRYKYAIYFSAAWSFFLLGTVVLAMNKFGLIPRTALTESAAQMGSAIEIILLSFALAERLHDESTHRLRAEKENRQINEALLQTQQQQNVLLEEEVNRQTFALKTALAQVQALNTELADLSTMDQVTGVRNRRYFDDMIDREFRRSRRNQSYVALIMVDIDHFKSVNDNFGHLAGDQCLRRVSSTLNELVKRPPDLVCRYGGEELAVVLPETHLEGALLLAERMRKHVASLKIDTDEGEVQVTASFGVSCLIPNNDTRCEDLIGLADTALYKAKQNGRNQVQSHILGEAIHVGEYSS